MVVPPVPLAQLELGDQQVPVVCRVLRDHKALLEHKVLKVFKALQDPLVNLVQLEPQDQVVLPDRKELPELWVYRV
jgi:hypothetical protein